MKYEIIGDNLPAVICNLENGEKMHTESGGMAWMSPNMQMETDTGGGIGKAFGRLFAGESFFNTVITGPGKVYIQTMPIIRVADALIPYMPKTSSSSD